MWHSRRRVGTQPAMADADAASPPQQQHRPPPPRPPASSDDDVAAAASDEALLTPHYVTLAPRGGITEGRKVALVHLRPPSSKGRCKEQPAVACGEGSGTATPIPASGEEEEEEQEAASGSGEGEEDEKEVTIFLMHGGALPRVGLGRVGVFAFI